VPRPQLPPEQLREAIRDLIGVLRAMYLAQTEESPGRRAAVVAAGQRLAELSELVDQQGTEAYQAAMRAADAAVDAVLGGLHFNAALAPVLGHAAGRVLDSRRR
jgi:hypothetical protein